MSVESRSDGHEVHVSLPNELHPSITGVSDFMRSFHVDALNRQTANLTCLDTFCTPFGAVELHRSFRSAVDNAYCLYYLAFNKPVTAVFGRRRMVLKLLSFQPRIKTGSLYFHTVTRIQVSCMRDLRQDFVGNSPYQRFQTM